MTKLFRLIACFMLVFCTAEIRAVKGFAKIIVSEPTVSTDKIDSLRLGVFVIRNSNITPNKEITSEIIKTLSQSSGISMFAIENRFHYSVSWDIEKKPSSRYHITAYLHTDSCVGNSNYKSFNISYVLVPNKVSGRLFISGSGNERIASTELNALNLNSRKSFILDTLISSSGIVPSLIAWNELTFFYDADALQAFKKQTELIDKYYVVASELPDIYERLNAFEVGSPDMAAVNDIRLDEIERRVAEIEMLHFPEKLNLAEHDPLSFLSLFQKIQNRIERLRLRINDMVIWLDREYYNAAIQKLMEGDTVQAQYFLGKSLVTNRFYHNSRIALARSYYFQNNSDSAASVLIAASNFSYIPEEDLKGLKNISKVVYFSFVLKGDALLNKEMFNEAIEEFAKAGDFCMNTTFFDCDDAYKRGLSEAKYGIYRSYLNIASNATANQRWKLALRYIELAKKYQDEHHEYIGNYSDADIQLTRVYERYISLGDAENKAGKYESALEYYNKALEFCQNYNARCNERVYEGIRFANHGIYTELISKAEKALSDGKQSLTETYLSKALEFQAKHPELLEQSEANKLLGSTRQSAYELFIKQGKELFDANRMLDAFHKFSEAEKLEREFMIDRDSTLHNYIAVTIKPYIFESIEKADFYVWRNRLDTARMMMNEINGLVKRFNYTADIALISSINEVAQRLIEKECANLQTEFNKLTYRAKAHLTDKQYYKSYEDLRAALSNAKNYPDCDVDISLAEKERERIKKPATYMHLMATAYENIEHGKYEEANRYYIEAQGFYHIEGISSFELKHLPLIEYVSRSSNISYVNSTIDYLIRYKYHEKSLSIVRLLAERRYPSQYLKKPMRQLARHNALKDMKERPEADIDNRINELVGNNERLKPFSRYYKWNRRLARMKLIK